MSAIMWNGKMQVLGYDQYFTFIQSFRTCKTILFVILDMLYVVIVKNNIK